MSIEQLNTKIFFFRPIETGVRRVITHFTNSRQAQQVTAADKSMGPQRLETVNRIRSISGQNVAGESGNFASSLHQFDTKRNFVTAKEPGIIIETKIEVGIRLAHELVARRKVALVFFHSIPGYAWKTRSQKRCI